LCWIPPESIAGVKREELFDFRGAKALWVSDSQLGIWMGDSAVFILGSRDRIARAAEEIAPLGNIEVTLTDSKLPPPNFDSCPETPIYPISTVVPYPPTPTSGGRAP
jgi:hypothetical protein